MKRPPRIQRRRKPNHDVDMTPMIDVVFLLLIFFSLVDQFVDTAGIHQFFYTA